MHKFKTNYIIILATIVGFYVSIIVGCDDKSYTDYIQSVPTQNETYVWDTTDDGLYQYRWEDNGACIIMVAGQEYNLQKSARSGISGPVTWIWEQDGDIDITIGTKQYDLDSPYDTFNNNDSEDYGVDGIPYSATTAILGAASAYKVSKNKVYGYDIHGNPLNKRGDIISKFGNSSKPTKFKNTSIAGKTTSSSNIKTPPKAIQTKSALKTFTKTPSYKSTTIQRK